MTVKNIDAYPFDVAFKNICPFTTEPSMRSALIDVADTVEMAKRMLLQSKVRDFTGSDVVNLTSLIIARETELFNRDAMLDNHDD